MLDRPLHVRQKLFPFVNIEHLTDNEHPLEIIMI